MAGRTVLAASALLLVGCILTGGAPADTRAFCKIVWLVEIPCSQASMAVATQMKAMGSYKLGSTAPLLIQANHTSSTGQMESVNFTMSSTTMDLGCRVEGSSKSQFWPSQTDNGTNYCNLHNVIKGSGLTTALGFMEYTNDWLCLGFASSVCI
ncbi:uncharacterized protein ACB058_015777 [Synchiropus picturatus]